tara:strand:+ start:96 stop:464 length:369 start_codon:yes stop_codon:yes gene_type:complete
MPRDKEKQKEYNRLYRLANKDKLKTNRYAQKDKLNSQKRDIRQTPQGKKTEKMAGWRYSGVNNVNDEMYDRYINTHCCDVCKNEFKGSYDRCLDHDHETGDFRQVLCRSCNNSDSWKDKIKE